REARSAVKIESEHVARVIDVGELTNGAPYMVMEYLDGNDLGHLVSQRGKLPIDEVIDYVLQACEAIAEAHAKGIVHRDLKPSNLFLTRRPDGTTMVKVLDFGISKATLTGPSSGPDMALTKTTAVMGSPLYMAPEQMRSTRSVDARADVWALGVILYELLTGRVPFEATTMPELCVMVLSDPMPPLGEHRPDAPPALSAVLARCLEKDPARRFANVSELANALVDFGPSRARTSAERISRVLRAAGVAAPSVAPPLLDTGSVAARTGDNAWAPSTTGAARAKKASFGTTASKIAAAAAVVAVVAIGAITVAVRRGSNAQLDLAATGPVASVPVQTSVPAITPARAPAPPASAVPEPSASPVPEASASAVPKAPIVAAQSAKRSSKAPAREAAKPGTTSAPAVKKNPLDIGLK
ncbi:MAG TPA: protein kinase, partial [Polyangiaceae bacterium]